MTQLATGRLLGIGAALIAALTIGVPAGSATRSAGASLTLNVAVNGSLEIVLGNGVRIRTSAAPGAVIPPGPYLAIVNTDVPEPLDVFHMFHLVGPGVLVQSDLLPCENPRQLSTVVLQPGSTYVYDDARHPEIAPIVFSTSAAGSSSDTSGAGAVVPNTKTSGTVSNISILGSNANLPYRGSLNATVGSDGTLKLLHSGKPFSGLKAGRYQLTVADSSHTVGLTIEPRGERAVTITGKAFSGKRTVTVGLAAGTWTFTTAVAKRLSFRVSG